MVPGRLCRTGSNTGHSNSIASDAVKKHSQQHEGGADLVYKQKGGHASIDQVREPL